MVSEGDIKLVARITALELLVQHLLWLAFGRNLESLRSYAAALNESLAGSHVTGFDPSQSDLLSAEIQAAVTEILGALIERQEARARDAEGDGRK